MPGSVLTSYVSGVSSDGTVVVGFDQMGNHWEAFRWTKETGKQSLGTLGGDSDSYATGISTDGSVISGLVWTFEEDDSQQEAVRWNNGTLVRLGVPSGCWQSLGLGVSPDGGTVVGYCRDEEANETPYVWRGSAAISLGHLPGGAWGRAFDASVEGAAVVGRDAVPFGALRGFRWTADAMVGLDPSATANAITPDGTVVVGRANLEAFRWTDSTGVTGLGQLPGPILSEAFGVSADGSTVVGIGSGIAFIWTQAEGMRSLKTVLEEDYGLDLTGWTLRGGGHDFAHIDISDDGSTIVGYGTNPQGQQEAWRAVLGGHRWINPEGGSWEEASNWSPATVPGEGDEVLFDLEAAYTVTQVGAAGKTHAARSASRLIVGRGTVDFADFGINLTAEGLDKPSLDIGRRDTAVAKIISGTGRFVDGIVGNTTELDKPTDVSRLQVLNEGTVLEGRDLQVGWRSRAEVFVAAGTLRTRDVYITRNSEVVVGNEGRFESRDLEIGERLEGRFILERGAGAGVRMAIVGGIEPDAAGHVEVGGIGPSGLLSRLSVLDTLFVGDVGPGYVTVGAAGEIAADQVIVEDGLIQLSGDAAHRGLLVANRVALADGALLTSPAGQLLVRELVVGSSAGMGSILVAGGAATGLPRGEILAAAPGLTGKCHVSDSADEDHHSSLTIIAGAYVRCDAADIGDTGAGEVLVGNAETPGADSLVVTRTLLIGQGDFGRLALVNGVVDAIDSPRNPPAEKPDVIVFERGLIEGTGTIRGQVGAAGFISPGITVNPSSQRVVEADAAQGGLAGKGSAGARTRRLVEGGTLTIEGALALGAGAVVEVPIAGAEPSLQGRLAVEPVEGLPEMDGSIVLAGTLRLAFQEGYHPRRGDVYAPVRAASMGGSFDQVEVTGLAPGFEFEVETVDGELVITATSDGTSTVTAEQASPGPAQFMLEPNWPNPFASVTRLSFALPRPGHAALRVYNVLGQEVTTLLDANVQAGRHEVEFDGSRLPAGIYFGRLEAEGGQATVRLVLLR